MRVARESWKNPAAAGIEARSPRAQESPFNILTSRRSLPIRGRTPAIFARRSDLATQRTIQQKRMDGAIADLRTISTQKHAAILTTPVMAYIKTRGCDHRAASASSRSSWKVPLATFESVIAEANAWCSRVCAN